MKVYRSTIINAPVGKVWETLRHFDSVVKWSPVVAKCYIEGGRAATEVGCVRHLTFKDGSTTRGALLALSDVERTFSYNILESPLPVRGYVASLHFQPITDDDRTFATWQVEFETDPDKEADMNLVIGEGLIMNGFDGMKHYFEKK